MDESEVVVKYRGDGSAYVTGIPARDLTLEEWAAIRPDLKALALATGLYQPPPRPDPLTEDEEVES